MKSYCVHINTTGDSTWTEQLLADLHDAGAPTDRILYQGVFNKKNRGMSFNEDKTAYEQALNQGPMYTVHLLIHAHFYKWYLSYIAQLLPNLEKDRKSILIYDKPDQDEVVPASSQWPSIPNHFPSEQEVNVLIQLIREKIGNERVLSRDEAIAHITRLLKEEDTKDQNRRAGIPWWRPFIRKQHSGAA